MDESKKLNDGWTIEEFYLHGMPIDSGRREVLKRITKPFRVMISDDNEISITCNSTDLYAKIHDLLQCILRIQGLFYADEWSGNS
jgi:acetolactate synthase small subunit